MTSSLASENLSFHHVGKPSKDIVRLADQAYLSIREEILRGRLRPGAPLSRRRLARELGMSVVPVADALRRLEEAGLVESRSRAGTRVRVPSESDVKSLYELREALETQSARFFAERATQQQRQQLRRHAEQVDVLFNRLATSHSDADFAFVVNSHHVQFHMLIAEHAGSPRLKEMIDRNHVLILNWLFDVTGRRTPLPAGFHSRLADALVSGHPDTADAAMRGHVRYGLPEISSQIRELAASEWRERPVKNAKNFR